MELEEFKRFTGLTDDHIKVIKEFINREEEYKPKGYWAKRPLKTDTTDGGEIWAPETVKKSIKLTPLNLPNKLSWITLDPLNKEDMESMSHFLNRYYFPKEENDNMSITYSPEILSWYLSTPNEKNLTNIVLGVVIEGTTRLVGTITGVYFKGSFYSNVRDMLDVDLFCIHPKLRSRGLAEVMIDELVRNMNLNGVFHGTFSGSRNLPNQVCTLKFHHRPLNTKKLIETQFITLENGTMEGAVKMFALVDDLDYNFREALPEDLDSIHTILNKHLERFQVHFIFTKDQVKHLFLNDCVDTYVYDKDDNITDFVSIFKMRYKVYNSHNKENSYIEIGQLFYYAYNEITLYSLIKNLLIVSDAKGIDVINCFDDMDNKLVLDSLNFTEGTGKVKHYLYNWITPELDPSLTAKHVI